MLTKKIAYCFLLFTIHITAFSQDLVLNEVMYSNKQTIRDSYGETPDWIEIYNTSDESIQLQHYALQDGSGKKKTWKFPHSTIEPHQYLLVFASGKNIQLAKEIHTDFKLGSMKEALYLLKHSDIIDSIEIQCVPTDASIGYMQDGIGAKKILQPSPGFSNNNSQTIDIQFTPNTITSSSQSGFYSKEFKLTLHSTNPDATVYYTLNGEEPTDESAIYSNNIDICSRTHEENVYANIRTAEKMWKKPTSLISKATVLRAVSYSHGCISSNQIQQTFFIVDSARNPYSVPVVSIITNPDNLFDKDNGIYVKGKYNNYMNRGNAWEREGYLELFDTSGQILLSQGIDMRIHGDASRTAPQKSLRLYAHEKYGTSEFAYPIFSSKPHINSYKTLILRCVRDWTQSIFKDDLCQDIVKNLNMDFAATQPVIVFLDGEYWGIHSLREYQDEHYLQRNFAPNDSLFHIISYPYENDYSLPNSTRQEYETCVDFIRNHNLKEPDNYNTACSMIDVNNLIDYFIVQSYFANVDFPHKNLKMWKSAQNDSALWRYLFFDCDWCMVRTQYNFTDEYTHTDEEFYEYPEWSTEILRNFFENKSFRNSFVQRFYYLLQHDLSPETVIDKINTYEQMFEPLIPEHTSRWHLPSDTRMWQYKVDGMKLFAMQRPLELYEELQSNFNDPLYVFPNPLPYGTPLYIHLPAQSDPISMIIRTMSGHIVFSQMFTTYNNNTLTLDVSLPQGVYIITSNYMGIQCNSKLIVQ